MKMLIVDDHTLFRAGFSLLLSSWNTEIELLEAESCEQAIARFKPVGEELELLFLDLGLAGASDGQAVELMVQHFPTVPIVLLTASDDRQTIEAALQKGAVGYLPKHIEHQRLNDAVERLLDGETYIFGLPDSGEQSECLDQLTQRQREIVKRLVLGKPNKTIARELDISDNTVRVHLSAIYQVLGVSNRTEAAHMVIAAGLHTK